MCDYIKEFKLIALDSPGRHNLVTRACIKRKQQELESEGGKVSCEDRVREAETECPVNKTNSNAGISRNQKRFCPRSNSQKQAFRHLEFSAEFSRYKLYKNTFPQVFRFRNIFALT